jgi:hypothetical protein
MGQHAIAGSFDVCPTKLLMMCESVAKGPSAEPRTAERAQVKDLPAKLLQGLGNAGNGFNPRQEHHAANAIDFHHCQAHPTRADDDFDYPARQYSHLHNQPTDF